VRIFELLNEGYTERFREIYAESSSEILGIEIDFWLTPLVFLNLFMVFQKAKNSFSISRCGFFFHCLSPCSPDEALTYPGHSMTILEQDRLWNSDQS